MSRSIGIDLGTANTIVYVKDKGIALREPSVVAVESRSKKVVAVGSEAKHMLGKTPGSIIAMRPLKDGVIAEFDFTTQMLRHFFKKVSGNTIFSRPKVMICVPYGVTEVEKRAVQDVTLEAGAQSVGLIEEPIAAAIGSGLKVESPRGSMIVDIGGGTAEVAVISLGDIVTSRSVRVAGDDFDSAISQYIKKKYNLLIGERTAEEIKIKIGSAIDYGNEGRMEVKGRNLLDGLPKNVTITSEEVREATEDCIRQILDAIKGTLEKTPPELSADIMKYGITLTGGGALLRGLNTLITTETGMPVRVADNPLDCVADGTGIFLNEDVLGSVGKKN